MEIKELHARQGNVEITAEVVEKSPAREFDKSGNKGRVCKAKIKDSSGTVVLTLWNEECDSVNVGDKIKISNGYVGEWQGELQLSAGKFGKIEVVSKAPEKVYTNVPSSNDEDSELEDESDDDEVEEEFF